MKDDLEKEPTEFNLRFICNVNTTQAAIFNLPVVFFSYYSTDKILGEKNFKSTLAKFYVQGKSAENVLVISINYAKY